MQTNKKTPTRMRLLAWFMAMVMMCTSISVPAFAEDISFDDEDAIELQSADEIDVEEIADFSDGICDEEILTDEASDMDIFFSAGEEENKEISENPESEAAAVDVGDEVQDEYLSSIKIGTNPSQLTEIFKGQTSEWSYTLAGRQKTIYVLATLSETAPEDSAITATYFDNSKQEQKTKTLSSTVRNNGLSNVAIQYSGKESSFTLTVGVEGNTREYKIKMPRSVEIKSPSLKASDGSALIEAEGVYLLPAEKNGSLRFKADVYNAAVTINGQSVTPESGVYTFTPQYDEKNEAEVKIAASYADNAEVKTELSYKVKHLTAEDTFSGTCGEALTWELKGDALTICGTGAMADYEQYGTKAGWNPYISLIKSVNVEQGVTSIGNYAFYYAKTMESITFPESLVSIGDGAFCDCTNLKKIEIPLSVTNVGTLAFGRCSGLEEATLGCVAGTQMFLNCTALKKVTWKGQPTIIPASAFLGCSTLEEISIPTSVTEIGASAFGNCKSLTSLQIPIGVTKIGSSAFSSCAKLTEVTIPTGVTAIESSTFANCSTLVSVTIPNGVTRIEDKAFANCTALATMTIPSSIVYVSASAFDGCSNLEGNITFEGSDSGYVTEDGLLYFKTANSKILLDGKSAEGSLTLPADVAAIDDGAFSGNTKLTEIVLQNGVKSIGKEAFKGCSALKKVTMTDSVTEIKEYAFYECTALEEVKLSNSLTEIAAYLFGKCMVLQTITIPEGVESIGSSAFWLCKGLERVTLPKSVRTLGSTCFGACSALKNLEIPDGVTELPLAMLGSCPALTTVSIPASVTKIGSNTFQYSVNLEYVLYGGSPEQWNQIEGAAMTGSSQPKVMVLYRSSHLGDQEKDAPVISEQPESAVYKKDAAAELMKVKAAALNEEGTTYFFNWQKNTEKTIKGGTSVSSVSSEDGLSSQIQPTTDTEGNTYYYCIVEKIKSDGTVTFTCSDFATVAVGETTFSGSGTEEDPYQLSTDADLIKLKQLVESGNSMSGIYFKMTADITLPKRWTPIGTTIDGSNDIKEGKNLYAFSGIFDGGGKTLTIPKNGYPLLNYVLGAEVRNLNIYGEQINGYGLVNNLSGRGLSGSAVVIDHVTLKKGSSTLKSGLIGAELSTSIYAGCSAGFLTTIRNCTIEEGVVIGYTKEEKQIGAIAGCMQGTVENCVSHAEVYGTNYVGGIIGTRDNALGQVQVSGCTFDGTVTASGEHAGGIVGGGYWHESAPNGNRISITDCVSSGTVIGADKVGGILGGDTYAAQPWANSAVKGNSFTGTVKATSGTYVGGIIGFYDSLNAYDDIANNYYSKDCGAEKGIGFVKYIDTSCETHETASGAVYFSTEKNTDGCPNVAGCWWYQGMNRTDDPMGSDAEKLASNNTEVQKYVKELAVSGEYKKEFYLGDALDLSGIEIKAVYSDGTEKEVSLSEVTVAGYDNMTRGEQTITLSYGGARAEITIKLLAEAGKVAVNFQILGDVNHGEDGTIHTLMENTLTSWLPMQTYKIDANATVYDLIKEIEAETEGLEILERYSETYKSAYIYGITFNGITLEELNNGPNSGWMYTVNGVHSQVGVSKEYMNNGDVIILHYTDDYTKEESTLYDQSIADGVTEQIQKIPSVDKLTLQDKAEVEAAREAYDTLTDSQKKMISTATLKLLEAAEARIAELEKNQHVCSWDAGTVTKKATCTETGIMTYKCTCGKTRTEVIEKAAHSYSKWIKVSDATVFAPEVQKHTCSVCKKIQTKNVGSKLKAVLEVPGNLSSISIKKGNTMPLNVTMANGDSVVSVKSSASKILKATLDKNGKITLKALKKGSVKLTIKLASKTEKSYKVSVVTGTVKTTKVTVTSVKNNKLTLKKGKTHTLKSELKPFTSTQKITYKTSDKKVVTVTSSGKIKAVGAGKATITVTSGSKKVKVAVTVPGIANLKSSVTVKKNKTTILKPKTYGISEKVTYTSSNLKVATVTATGKVKGVKKGTAKITVQAGTYKYIVTVKVK